MYPFGIAGTFGSCRVCRVADAYFCTTPNDPCMRLLSGVTVFRFPRPWRNGDVRTRYRARLRHLEAEMLVKADVGSLLGLQVASLSSVPYVLQDRPYDLRREPFPLVLRSYAEVEKIPRIPVGVSSHDLFAVGFVGGQASHGAETGGDEESQASVREESYGGWTFGPRRQEQGHHIRGGRVRDAQ